MNVLVIGANGKIGRLLVEKLAMEKGFFVRAMVRKAEQVSELEKLGAKPIIADLKKDFHYAYDEIEAVIFTAGSGGHTPASETINIDQNGAIKAIETAKEKGVRRFIIVSSYGADNPENGPESLIHYLKAKQAADEELKEAVSTTPSSAQLAFQMIQLLAKSLKFPKNLQRLSRALMLQILLVKLYPKNLVSIKPIPSKVATHPLNIFLINKKR